MKTRLVAVAALVMLVLAACAPGPNLLKGAADEEGEVAGFWRGLWHGIILPITFIVSLFTDEVGIYETHNAGGWYNLGFLLGAAGTLGGSSKGTCRGRKRRG